MVSRRGEESGPTRFRPLEQFARHNLQHCDKNYEWLVKVFNRTVENFVEKVRPEMKIPRQT
jgi:hypothetical protein